MTIRRGMIRAALGERPLRRLGVLTAAAVTLPPIAAASALIAVDAVKHGERKVREAPRPGTFTSTVENSHLTIYTSGSEVYDDMIAAIDEARTSVLMETFIWKGDEVGERFVDAMNRAAARGVDVRVLYDGFANLVVPASFYERFSADVQLKRLPAVARPYWRGLLRHTGFNHSKILVVDDTVGFVGGYNIGDTYAREWRDTHVRLVGATVWGLRNSVKRAWNDTGPDLPTIPWVAPHEWDPEVRVAANLPVQLVYPIRQLYLDAIERAQHHICITTPYFIPDQQILEALLRAADRGVDVRVMVPKKSNHVVADFASRGFYKELLDRGVTILQYKAAMIHAKTATIDGIWSTVGTANIDRLSLSFNFETNIEVIDQDFARNMETVFAADSEHCVELTSPAWRERHRMARVMETMLVPLR
ncbi:MAG: phospholipase D-like domain-containing protein, partial [Brachybacterium sp.]|nr:phospholipase D-like domain-containing protein [Brachybacterium sp.]